MATVCGIYCVVFWNNLALVLIHLLDEKFSVKLPMSCSEEAKPTDKCENGELINQWGVVVECGGHLKQRRPTVTRRPNVLHTYNEE